MKLPNRIDYSAETITSPLMAYLQRVTWLRVLLALQFASATVIGLSFPSLAMALGSHHAVLEQGSHDGHSQHGSAADTPLQSVDPVSSPGCVIHCLGLATLIVGFDVSRPRLWLVSRPGDQVGEGFGPARIERPPDL